MKLRYLEAFRGYMSLWVFFFHGLGFLPHFKFNNFFYKTFTDGMLPVLCFMILSGFVTHILLSKEESFSLYITRRFLRLFPIYIIAFLISLVMLDFSMAALQDLPVENPKIAFRIGLIDAYFESDRILNIISHLLLLHGIFPNRYFPFTYTIMGQSWSLTLEWQFYLFIPFLYNYIKTKKLKYLVVLVLFSIVTILSYRYMRQASFLPSMIQYFLIGYFSYPLYKKWNESRKPYLFYFLLAIAVYYSFFSLSKSLMIALWSLVLYFQVKNNKFSELILGSQVALYLGRISYSFYALHMISFFISAYILELMGVKDIWLFSVLILLLAFSLTLLLSHLGYKYIEDHFVKLGKNIKTDKLKFLNFINK